jgi:hypothetical protein
MGVDVLQLLNLSNKTSIHAPPKIIIVLTEALRYPHVKRKHVHTRADDNQIKSRLMLQDHNGVLPAYLSTQSARYNIIKNQPLVKKIF